ncbi:DEAD-box ATP-dependent RNA helicase 36 [Aduncisulcus paluster]|uniref:DEAD-box ATP-dependent RNA helicase 36 n=1 Tax=Aduncisulcus paluster TaxID=2918883 RepID=A0ABQ5JZG1_9EUKA|nr:DEAD-box ATP-dependent RNA helicase 36 [Aduncisulcus paluster]
MNWKKLGLSPRLCLACKSLGYDFPTEIQEKTIPSILKGETVAGIAKTGSGKTAAFALPILSELESNPRGVYSLVLTPTRELAFQIKDSFSALGEWMGLRITLVTGGMSIDEQCRAIMHRPHIVIATPGRLSHLLIDPEISNAFKRVEVVVLDEADVLMETGSGFQEQIINIFSHLPSKEIEVSSTDDKSGETSTKRVKTFKTHMFTATISPQLKLQIETLVQHRGLKFFSLVEGDMELVSSLTHTYVLISDPAIKPVILHELLTKKLSLQHIIVFTSTRETCHLVGQTLVELGLEDVSCLHGLMSQKERMESIKRFKARQSRILVCTDVAGRGLDIPTVEVVINFDIPLNSATYIHRVGRTARRGQTGLSISFVGRADVELVKTIETDVKSQMKEFRVNLEEVLKSVGRILGVWEGVTARRGQTGLSISFVGRADVELVKTIETDVKSQMKEFRVNLEEVLKSVGRILGVWEGVYVKMDDDGTRDKMKMIKKRKHVEKMKRKKGRKGH